MRYAARVLTALALVLGVLAVAPIASATQPDPNHRVTICHRTNSTKHPYVVITVDEASINGQTGDDRGKGDHSLDHLGPVWTPDQPNGGDWGDIIPTFYANGAPGYWPGLNWPAGQSIFEAGCKVPAEPETSIVVQKLIPPVLEGSETISISFELDFEGNFVDSCTITFDANSAVDASTGDLIGSACEFDGLAPGLTYQLLETDSGGFDEMSPNPMNVIAGSADADPVTVTVMNTYEPAMAEACKTTVLVNANGSTASDTYFKFTLYEDGKAVWDVFIGGSTPSHPTNCKTFNFVLKDNHTYTIAEDTKVYKKTYDTNGNVVYVEDSQSGWTFGPVTCTVDGEGNVTSFTPQYPGDAGALFSCNVTNTRTFEAALAKTSTKSATATTSTATGWRRR